MSVNVIEQILANALQVANLVGKSALKGRSIELNRWQTGEGLQAIQVKKTAAKSPNNLLALSFKKRLGNQWYITTTSSKRKLLLDIGASYHMVSVHDLTPEESKTSRNLTIPVPLQTADHIMWVSECVDIWISELAV